MRERGLQVFNTEHVYYLPTIEQIRFFYFTERLATLSTQRPWTTGLLVVIVQAFPLITVRTSSEYGESNQGLQTVIYFKLLGLSGWISLTWLFLSSQTAPYHHQTVCEGSYSGAQGSYYHWVWSNRKPTACVRLTFVWFHFLFQEWMYVLYVHCMCVWMCMYVCSHFHCHWGVMVYS